MQHLNCYSNLQTKRSKVRSLTRGLCPKNGKPRVDSCGKKSSKLCFLNIVSTKVLISIFNIIAVLCYRTPPVAASAYRLFLMPCYNIIQCIVFNTRCRYCQLWTYFTLCSSVSVCYSTLRRWILLTSGE